MLSAEGLITLGTVTMDGTIKANAGGNTFRGRRENRRRSAAGAEQVRVLNEQSEKPKSHGRSARMRPAASALARALDWKRSLARRGTAAGRKCTTAKPFGRALQHRPERRDAQRRTGARFEL